MQTALLGIWIQVAKSTSYNDIHYTTTAFVYLQTHKGKVNEITLISLMKKKKK